MRTLGVITARGGSKSIPKKNIATLAGKPLIAYTIEASLNSSLLTRTVVSTDDDEIASTARQFGGDVPFMRPTELAGDHSGSIEVVQHALSWLDQHDRQTFDYAMILQPTSPFRLAEDIDAALQIALAKNADSVMSMVEVVDFSPLKLKRIDQHGRIEPLFAEEGKTSARRQSEPSVYKRNAAIYLTRTSLIMKGELFGANSFAHVMPQKRSLDINTPFDLAFAQFLMCLAGQDPP